jgi:hypothetical protein
MPLWYVPNPSVDNFLEVESTSNKLNLEECFGIIKENIVSSSDSRCQDYLIFLSNGNFRLTQKVVASLGLVTSRF